MKVVLALCLIGAASAAVLPLTYTVGGSVFGSPSIIPYTGGALPYTYTSGAFPFGVQPITYVAKPVVTQYVQPGYVAQTKGSLHIAPLPAGHSYASHHVNIADAPGTA